MAPSVVFAKESNVAEVSQVWLSVPLPPSHISPDTFPAPNKYFVHHDTCSNYPSPPRHSMSPRLPPPGAERSRCPSPGPSAYFPRPGSSTGVSITPRRERKKGRGVHSLVMVKKIMYSVILLLLVSTSPAPNCYSVEQGQTRQGKFTGPVASMKGRQTPALYSGFPSSHMARLQSFST